MALNASGPISLGGSTSGQSINLLLGRANNATISLNESTVRSLAGKSTAGTAVIIPTDFYGKSIGGETSYFYYRAATASVPAYWTNVASMVDTSPATYATFASVIDYNNRGLITYSSATGGATGIDAELPASSATLTKINLRFITQANNASFSILDVKFKTGATVKYQANSPLSIVSVANTKQTFDFSFNVTGMTTNDLKLASSPTIEVVYRNNVNVTYSLFIYQVFIQAFW